MICTAGSAAAYQQALLLLRNLGTVICVGLIDENLSISPFEMVVRGECCCSNLFQIELLGQLHSLGLLFVYALGLRVIWSSVVTAEEMQELLDMALVGDVIPIVEVFEFESIDLVLQALCKSQIAGRMILRIPQ